MKCELCRTTEIGEYIKNRDGSKTSKFYDNAKIMPCCKAEMCKKCYQKMAKKGVCEFCGKRL
jgi:hypothetical protein